MSFFFFFFLVLFFFFNPLVQNAEMPACAGRGFASSEPLYQKTQDHIKPTGPYQRQPLPPTTHKPYWLVNFAFKKTVFFFKGYQF